MINKVIVFAFLGLIVAGVAAYFIARMNVQTTWNQMNNATNAAFERQKVAHDEMWKTIKSNLGLKDELRDVTFKAMEAYAERGKSQSGAQWLWLQEQFPQLNQTGMSDFYQKLANIISDQNGKFTSVRNEVIYTTNEYNNYVTNSWRQMFLTSEQCKTRKAKIITSGVTNKAAETGEDDLEWMNK